MSKIPTGTPTTSGRVRRPADVSPASASESPTVVTDTDVDSWREPDARDVTLRVAVTVTHRSRVIGSHLAFAGACLLMLALGYFVLNPLIGSGYLSDDSWNSQVASAATLNDVPLHTFWWDVTQGWMETVGRFFPGSLFLAYYVFALFDTLDAYKAYQMIMLLTTIALFAWFVFRMTSSRAVALLAGLGAVACMQMRVYFDPIVSFAGQQQAIVILVLAAALLLRSYLVSGRAWWLVAGTVAWVLALVTYETSYPMIAMMALVTLVVAAPWKRRIISMVAYLIPLLALGIFVSHLRGQVANVEDTGYVSNFEPHALFRTLWIQLYAAGPDSQQHFALYRNWRDILATSGISEFPHRAVLAAFEAVVVSVCFLRIPRLSRRVVLVGLGLSLIMLVVPAAVIAQSKHWQDNLVLGVAYISVYMEFFGLAMLAALLLAVVRNLLRWRGLRVLGVLALGVGLAVGAFVAVATQGTAQANIASMKRLNDSQFYPRDTFALAVRSGLFDEVEDGTHVASTVDHAEPHYNSCFIAMSGGPHIKLIHPAIGLPGGPNGCAQPIGSEPGTFEPAFALNVDLGTNTANGIAWLAELDPEQPKLQDKDGTTSKRAVTTQARFFVRDPRLVQDPKLMPRLRCLTPDRASIFGFVDGVERGSDWLRFDVSIPDDGCLIDTMTVLLP